MPDEFGPIGGLCEQTWEVARRLELEASEQGKQLCVQVKDSRAEGYPWATNGLRFATATEAAAYGRNLSSRWMAVCAWQVAIADDPPVKPVNPGAEAQSVGSG